MDSTILNGEQKVGSIVVAFPAFAKVFESFGIDYCCGGQRTLQAACKEKNLDADVLVKTFLALRKGFTQPVSLDTPSLIAHIVEQHHGFLRRELPRVVRLTEKVFAAHGADDSRLEILKDLMAELSEALLEHLNDEEQLLFPRILSGEMERTLSAHDEAAQELLAELERDHENVGHALARIHHLTEGFRVPPSACNTYRAMLLALKELEEDTHQHVHLENNVLFQSIRGDKS